MSVQQAFHLRNPILLMALAAVYPVVAYSAGAGTIDFSAGSVTAVNAAGVQRPLTKGAEISNGDTLHTGDGGRAQVRFSDGAMVSLQPQTEFRVDNYQFAGKSDGQEKGFFSLLKGGMRTITGLIGRSNRDNYKVTTNVATIGIRGTEYTGALDPDTGELVVNTGEGQVEVCNSAGCMLLASGESGRVSGASSAPRRTDSRPQLPPAQPTSTLAPDFSTSENRAASGGIAPVSAPLVSGPSYATAFAGMKAGVPFTTLTAPETGAATFSPASELVTMNSAAANVWQAGTVAGSFTADGVIGWGVWTTGTVNTGSVFPLSNMHYVTGVPTPGGELTALGGITATYALVGFTHPTTSTGVVGSDAVSGTLTAAFGGTLSTVVTADMVVPVAGTLHKFSGTVFSAGSSPTFGGTLSSCVNCSGASISGFFSGQNASHAGLTYQFTSSSGALGTVSGAAAFKQ